MTRILGLFAILELVIILSPPFTIHGQSVDLTFAGYPWKIKSSRAAAAPGPNLFSPNAVSLEDGGLRLSITREDEGWICGEIFCQQKLGYGTYRFLLTSRWEDFPDQAVLGLFTYSHQPEYYHREIDIEVARWNGSNPGMGQFTVQPHSNPSNKYQFQMPARGDVEFSIRWLPEMISFTALAEGMDESWSYQGDIPPPGSEKVHINLWLYQGTEPREEISVLLKEFSFTPPGNGELQEETR